MYTVRACRQDALLCFLLLISVFCIFNHRHDFFVSCRAGCAFYTDGKLTFLNDCSGIYSDLSVMSGTVVYAEVYNIVTDPDTYRGKTIKMTGNLATYHDDKTGMDYFACIIPDATACSSQGIEFRTTDSFRYPEDYPEIGKEITVIGTFDTYKEEPYEYPVLDQAVIV